MISKKFKKMWHELTIYSKIRKKMKKEKLTKWELKEIDIEWERLKKEIRGK